MVENYAVLNKKTFFFNKIKKMYSLNYGWIKIDTFHFLLLKFLTIYSATVFFFTNNAYFYFPN